MIRIFRARAFAAVSVLALAASATVTTLTTSTPAYAADTLLCCDQVVDANNPAPQNVAGLLGVDVSRTVGEVGLQCTPMSSVGGAGRCNAHPVVCASNNLDGIIATGCRPGNVGV
ncbi:hypothetical protein GCM10010218_06660 [Streptomyces mashuensis]|uniref:Hydrophobin n=1 Tax=Streptomyces mashuensis TaxID=33904 RepID=A0A919AXJ3_9ACTN|nr:hydrophobin family protein [Streptomyces mashuensis]GHF28218.1 hypothetical protein GCM10010218_06660 [Streptomyces mashuensis]